jgi:hypothetical protein
MRRTTAVVTITLPLAAFCGAAQAQTEDASDPLVFFLSEQLTYDDNLFRVGGRDDARLQHGRQDLLLTARIYDTSFKNNDRLDYTGGAGNLAYHWALGSRWSGKLTADYIRTLASYTNYQFTERDVVASASTELEGRYQLGPRFSLIAAGRTTRTDHSDQDREPENFEGDGGRAGIEFMPRPGKRFILEYRYSEGRFPERIATATSNGRERDYDEDLLNLRVEYEITSKLHLLGNVGYLERDYVIESANPGFDGEIWRGTLEWQPRTKLGFDLSAWRELKAYIDAESNYFVARGISLGPRWQPLQKIQLGLEYIYEEQNYIGSPTLSPDLNTPVLVTDAGREDDVQAARFTASYAPREHVDLNLRWSYEERSSNRPLREHHANVIGVEVGVVF